MIRRWLQMLIDLLPERLVYCVECRHLQVKDGEDVCGCPSNRGGCSSHSTTFMERPRPEEEWFPMYTPAHLNKDGKCRNFRKRGPCNWGDY